MNKQNISMYIEKDNLNFTLNHNGTLIQIKEPISNIDLEIIVRMRNINYNINEKQKIFIYVERILKHIRMSLKKINLYYVCEKKIDLELLYKDELDLLFNSLLPIVTEYFVNKKNI